jgi:hypothetical protein
MSPHSGEDPMGDEPIAADAARAMQTVIRSHTLDRAARGRFGRDVRDPATDDAQQAGTTMQTDDALERVAALGYRVDPDAVAGAIIDRLLAGRTLPNR